MAEKPKEMGGVSEKAQSLPVVSEEPKSQGGLQKLAFHAVVHSGPLPDPQTLREYKQIDPDLFRTVIEMAKDEQKHRHDMERTVKQAGARRSTWGMMWAGALGLAAIASATYLGLHGMREVAIAVVGIPTGGVLTSFLVGSYNNKAERIEKEKIRRSTMTLPGPEEDVDQAGEEQGR